MERGPAEVSKPSRGQRRAPRTGHHAPRVAVTALMIGVLAMLSLAQTGCPSCERGRWETRPYLMCTPSGGATLTAPDRFGFPGTLPATAGRTCMDLDGKCTVTPSVGFSIPFSVAGSVRRPGMALDIDLISVESGMTYSLPLTTNQGRNLVSASIIEEDSSGTITHTHLELVSGTLAVDSLTLTELRVSFAMEMTIPETKERVSLAGGAATISGCAIRNQQVCVGGD